MILRAYPEGLDCMWLASDGRGNLGVFLTAGAGPIPKLALDRSQIPVESIEEVICTLPAISEARLLVSVKRPDDFIDLAKRGFFVYDWSDIHRTTREALGAYEPVAVPSKPITASSLPSDLAALATALRLANVAFPASVALEIRAHLDCAES